MPTPNRGYPVPTDQDNADVPDDLEKPLLRIDADVQTVVDGLETKADGEYVSGELNTIRNDVAALPTVTEVEEIAEEQAVLHGTPAGSIPIFPTLVQAQAWEAANPGREALTTQPPPDPDSWRATPPTFDLNARNYVIPSDAGATYRANGVPRSAGTYGVGSEPVTIQVAAVAKSGYTLSGTTEWEASYSRLPDVPYRDAVLSDGPVHYLPMDDAQGATTARNLGSAGGNLAVTGLTFGGAGIGDRSTSAVSSTAASMVLPWGDPKGTGFTVEMILYLTSTPASDVDPIYASSAGLVRLYVDLGITSYFGTVGSAVPKVVVGQALHLAFTYSSDGTQRGYINGVERFTASNSTWPIGTLGGIRAGRAPGRVAGVAYYAKTLTASRIATHARSAGAV